MQDTLWVMICTLLTLMLVFGLSITYSGLCRWNFSISSGLQALFPAPLIAVYWACFGYSLAFAPSESAFLGGIDYFFANSPSTNSHSVDFAVQLLFQATFAIIACAVIVGALLERVRIIKIAVLGLLWTILVYTPVAYWVWTKGGWIESIGAIDFAGGLVVHLSSGVSALAALQIVGRRKDYFSLIKKNNNIFIILGTLLIWIGWFGFNSGAALAFNQVASDAFVSTFFAPVASFCAWTLLDHIHTPHRTYASHFSLSIIAGLVAITPMAGFTSITEAITVGLIAGAACNYSVRLMHKLFKQDDTADVFSTHAICGFIGMILLPVLVDQPKTTFSAQIISSMAVAAYCFILTYFLFWTFNRISPLRISDSDEEKGLDLIDHGEKACNVDA